MEQNKRTYIERDNVLKNDGSKGAVCNNCGGYGFTNGLNGAALGCQHCEQTGIQLPSRLELQKQITELQEMLKQINGNTV